MKVLGTILAFGLLLAVPSTVLADSTTDKIRAVYAAQCQDFLTGDWTSLYNQMTPDYTERGSDGTVMTREQVMSSMQRHTNGIKFTACDPDIRTVVDVSRNQFATTVLLKLSATSLTAMGKFAKGDQIESDTLATDTWTQRDDGTLLLSTSVKTGTQSIVNGMVIAKQGNL